MKRNKTKIVDMEFFNHSTNLFCSIYEAFLTQVLLLLLLLRLGFFFPVKKKPFDFHAVPTLHVLNIVILMKQADLEGRRSR